MPRFLRRARRPQAGPRARRGSVLGASCVWLPALALALALAAPLALPARAQAQRRCNEAPAGAQSSYGSSGLTSLARRRPETVQPAPVPRLWLNAGIALMRMPYHWSEATVRLTALPATWLWTEGRFGYGLPAQTDLDARAGMWADGRAGVRLWRKAGEAPWRFVLQACRGSNYMPSGWEGPGRGGALPEAGGMGTLPEPTRLDYVFVDVPVEHAVWLDGGVRWGSLAYCQGSCEGGRATAQAAVRTWAGGVRYTRFTSALLDHRSRLRASFEAWAYVLFRPQGLPGGDLEVIGPLLPDRVTDGGPNLGFEGGVRYTPWAFEWAQIELGVGYTPAARDLYLELGFSFPLWLL